MEVCKNCGTKLIVKSTASNAAAQKKRLEKQYYYSAYYFCPHCKKLYHDEKFKFFNNQTSLLSPTPVIPDLIRNPENELDSHTKGTFGLRGNDKEEFIVSIWTDGACIHNGTPHARAAWGFVSGKTEKAGLVEGLQTNNRAEAYAIYHALVWAAEKNYRKIKIHTDSQISIHGVSKDPSRVLKNREIFELIAKVIRGCHLQVEFVKVLGHSGDENNDRVDRLANELARNGRQ